MNKKISKIVSKLFLCLILATSFCTRQVICLELKENLVEDSLKLCFATNDPNLIKIDDNSRYKYSEDYKTVSNSIATYGNMVSNESESPQYQISLISVNNDSSISSLIIPKGFQIGDQGFIVTSVASSVFQNENNLKYVKLEHNDKVNFVGQIDNGAFNFSSATNLEAVYVKFDPEYSITDPKTGELVYVKDKFNKDFKYKLLQYVDISSETINVQKDSVTGELFTYGDGGVTISFGDIIESNPGYGYKITRSYANSSSDEETSADSSGDDEVFDSNGGEVSNFSVNDGKVTFTDYIEQTEEEQEYNYTITAYDPFEKSVESKEDILVKIPAKTVSNPTPKPETPNEPSTIRPSNPVITPPTDNSQDEDDDEDETPKPATPNEPSTTRPSNPVITPPTDNSQDEDNDEDETPKPATPNEPSTIRPSNPVITPPTDNSQDEDNDEDETPKPETEILEPNENIHEEAEKITNQEIDNTENNYQTGDILTKKILIITSIVFIIASISLWIIFNKKRKN